MKAVFVEKEAIRFLKQFSIIKVPFHEVYKTIIPVGPLHFARIMNVIVLNQAWSLKVQKMSGHSIMGLREGYFRNEFLRLEFLEIIRNNLKQVSMNS